MKMSKEVINKYIYKSDKLIHEQNLTMEQIYYYSYVLNKRGIAFEYFDIDNKYRSLTYKQVNKNTYKYAGIISKVLEGDEKHNAVILKYTNSPEWCEIFYAILMAGFKPLLVNASTSVDGVENLAKQAKAVAVITDDPFQYKIKKITVEEIVLAKEEKGFKPDWENEVIFCSSGTTGDVKLMVFTGENMCYQVVSAIKCGEVSDDIMYPKKYGSLKILAMIPFHHIFGFVAVFLWYAFYNKTIVFPANMNSKEIQKLCVDHGITHIYSVPLFFDSVALQFKRFREICDDSTREYLDKLLAMNLENGPKLNKIVISKIQENVLGSKIKMCISGGGYLSDETSRIINGIGYPLFNGFGMTEIGVASVELTDDVNTRLLCSIGKPFYHIEYKIKNNENTGELLVKSPTIHSKEIVGGVWKNTELDSEGYLHTGDIVTANPDGRYFIKGRLKDIIINADGENIFPDELELYFKNIGNLNSYTIIGVRKNKNDTDELVTFVGSVNLETPYKLKELEDEIKEAAKHLPNKVQIDQIYFTHESLPVSNSLKIKRHLIKEDIESKSDKYFTLEDKCQEKKVINFSDEVVLNILTPVKKIFAEVLTLKEQDIKNDDHWINDLGGDSMNYFELITRINERFNLVVPDEKFIYLMSVNDFVQFIIDWKEEGK